MLIQVKAGTRAGWRIVRKRPDWECLCVEEDGAWLPAPDGSHVVTYVPRVHPGSRYSCGDCGMRRPA